MLDIPTMTTVTALLMLHRYVTQVPDIVQNPSGLRHLCAACIFLACKTEEHAIKVSSSGHSSSAGMIPFAAPHHSPSLPHTPRRQTSSSTQFISSPATPSSPPNPRTPQRRRWQDRPGGETTPTPPPLTPTDRTPRLRPFPLSSSSPQPPFPSAARCAPSSLPRRPPRPPPRPPQRCRPRQRPGATHPRPCSSRPSIRSTGS